MPPIPTFKYAAEHQAVLPCPEADHAPANRTAYRFVFQPIAPTSFLPVMLTPRPQGTPPPRRNNQTVRCDHFALSMFDTEEHATKKYESLRKNSPQIHLTLGSHLAVLMLQVQHGVQSSPTPNGHFRIHEYDGVELAPLATLVKDLTAVTP